jgi:hypothetical protein
VVYLAPNCKPVANEVTNYCGKNRSGIVTCTLYSLPVRQIVMHSWCVHAFECAINCITAGWNSLHYSFAWASSRLKGICWGLN